jgi:hypothetical protein
VIDRGGRGPTASCLELVIVDPCQNPRLEEVGYRGGMKLISIV